MIITLNPTLINGKPYSDLSESEKKEVSDIIDALTAAVLLDQ